MKKNIFNALANRASTGSEPAKKKAKRTPKMVEANARRRDAMRWDCLSHTKKYQKAAVKESSECLNLLMQEELFDGFFLDLHPKSYSSQKRILRRIVDKRQAQSIHRHIGRREDLLEKQMSRYYAGHSMSQLKALGFRGF